MWGDWWTNYRTLSISGRVTTNRKTGSRRFIADLTGFAADSFGEEFSVTFLFRQRCCERKVSAIHFRFKLHSLNLGKFKFEEQLFTAKEISMMEVNIMKALHWIRSNFNTTSLNGFQLIENCSKCINGHSVWNNQLKGLFKFALKNHLLWFYSSLVTSSLLW